MSKMLGLIFLIVFLFGCTQIQNVADVIDNQNNAQNEENNSELNAPFYEPFTVERFEAAKAQNKIILLEFYANWCPECKNQKPILEQAFRELTDEQIVGFQVNFKDSDTDESEVALARKFSVPYQHTHVVINSSENVLLKEIASQWDKETTKNKLLSTKMN